MAAPNPERASIATAITPIVNDLVRADHWEDASFINLPLIYRSGGHVTLKIERVANGFRVSDNGFAYREIEVLGAQRSYARRAAEIARADGLERNSRVFYLDVAEDQLYSAICEIGIASWRVVDSIFADAVEDDGEGIEEHLRERLITIFGKKRVTIDHAKMNGASTNPWDVTALVKDDNSGHVSIFQAVSPAAAAIYRTSSAFRDLADLDKPPTMIAVVKSKGAFGSRLGLLSRVGRIIEENQPDAVYLKAAA